MKLWQSIFVIVSLVSICLSAPFNERSETDPELTAGYFQGDIVLENGRNGILNEQYRWPNKIVYYKFAHAFDTEHSNHILTGMRTIEAVSCIRFQEAAASQRAYVSITGSAGGCYSHVGYSNSARSYNLEIYPVDQGCFRLGTIIHEFLHTLGFYHMHSSFDRDDYVHIAEENIQANTLSNFNKYSASQVDHFSGKYDYGSVMHYSPYAFSINGQMTIVPLKDSQAASIMGQRDGMSADDIKRLNVMYKC